MVRVAKNACLVPLKTGCFQNGKFSTKQFVTKEEQIKVSVLLKDILAESGA